MTLDPRLSLCAELVPENSVVADIGTDHAYLPIYLVECGKAVSATAADIRKGPLEAAEKNVRKHRLENKITLCLSDGLKNIPRDGINCIVIAGMGGETIAGIIENCNWAASAELVLQPMTKAEYLRKFLYENGWDICKEKAVCCGKFVYTAMKCRYTGEKAVPTGEMLAAGALDISEEASVKYITNKISSLEKSGKAKLSAGDDSGKEDLMLAEKLMKIISE